MQTITLQFDDDLEYEFFKIYLKKFIDYWDKIKNNKNIKNNKDIKNISHEKFKKLIEIEKKYGTDILNNYLNLQKYNNQDLADYYLSIIDIKGIKKANNYFNNNFQQKISIRKRPIKIAPKIRFKYHIIGYDTIDEAEQNKKPGEIIYICRVLIHKYVDTNFPIKYYVVNPNKSIYSEKITSYIRSCWINEYDQNKNAEINHKKITGKHYGTHITACKYK